MPRIISVLFLLIFLLSSGCNSNSQNSKQLRLNLVDSPTSLDPQCTRNLSSLFLARHLFEGLFRYENDVVQQALCRSYEVSDDFKTYKFHLRNASFSDGSRITAYDFFKTIQHALDPSKPIDYVQLLYIIENAKEIKESKLEINSLGIKVISDDCIEFKLKEACPNFCSFLTHPIFFPKKDGINNQVYSGPFLLKTHELKQKIVLEKNPNYFDKNFVIIDQIIGYFVSNETAEIMFQDNLLDFIGSPLGSITQEAIEKFKKDDLLKTAPFLATSFLRLNTQHPFLNDIDHRLILKELIKKAPIVEKALMNLHHKTDVLVPASLKLKTECPTDSSFKLMRNDLCENLELKFSISDSRNQKIACLIKEVIEKNSHLKILLKPCEGKTLLQDLSKRNFELLLLSWIADYDDPENFLELFYDSKRVTNGTGWENPNYQQALSDAKKHPLKRDLFFAEAEKILLNDAPIIPLFQFNMIYVKEKKLEDYSLNSFGILDFKKAHF